MIGSEQLDLPESWLRVIGAEFQQPYMRELNTFLNAEKAVGKRIFPRSDHIFNAFKITPFDQVKVVILGQDPYHGPGQAHGLSFSVEGAERIPPSLRNIFKALQDDIEMKIPTHGDLTIWAEQGVLLLNSVLTVEAHNAGSHAGKGWEKFTDTVIRILNDQREGVVFLLWGKYAHKKGGFINREKHCVLEAPHPSPLAAYRGFFGCKHFSQANDYLKDNGRSEVNWAALNT